MAVRSVVVIGAGLVGGSIAVAARAAGIAHVTLVDPDPDARGVAERRGLAHEVLATFPAEAWSTDLVVAAVPSGSVPTVLADAGTRTAEHCILTDAASLKLDLTLMVETALGGVNVDVRRYIGSHPMAGSERSGPAAADPRLFQGATWVVTPTEASDAAVLERLGGFLRGLGARVLALSPERHDELVAVVSHLPQLAASTLADVAADAAERAGQAVLAVAGGGFRDTTRIAASDPALWLDILHGNRGAVLAALGAYRDRISTLHDALADQDWAQVTAMLERSSQARRRWADKAEVTSALDLVVALDDRPGTLAAATTALGEAGINVEDLAMRHAADGARGALVLRVAEHAAPRASAALQDRGLLVHVEDGADPPTEGPGDIDVSP